MTKYKEKINLWEWIPAVNNFYWEEALLLPKLNIYALPPSVEVYKNIVNLAKRLQWIRNFYGLPVKVTSWYRPPFYNKYLKDVHGYKVATKSAHLDASGADFKIKGLATIDEVNQVKEEIYPHLEDLQCRMCMNTDQSWIHIDLKGVGGFTY